MDSFELSNDRLLTLFHKAPEDDLKELYKRHSVRKEQDLVSEIRRDGSNTITTWVFRFGKGVNYEEIVRNVASKVGVKYKPADIANEAQLELMIVQHLIKKHFDALTPEERAEFQKHLDQLGKEYKDFWRQFLEAKGAAILALVQVLGRQFVATLLAQIMARLVVVSGGSLIVGRLVGLAIPFLNVALAAWFVIDIAGPAYRKTVPTVFQIALLRLQYGQ